MFRTNITKSLVISLMAIVLLMTTYSPISKASNNNNEAYNKYAGKNRYITSYNIAKSIYPEGTKNAIVVSGEVFADSLSATSLSKKYDAPILLSSNSVNFDELTQTIKKLKIEQIYIVGGPGSVNTTVENNLKKISKVTRFSGKDRYETNMEVMKASGFTDYSKVIVASGETFPDAMSIGAYSYQNDIPLFLSKAKVPDITYNNVMSKNPQEIILVGGSTVVDSTSRFSKKSIRLSGKDRYETNKIVYDTYYKSKESIIISVGDVFPDALSAVPLAGKLNTNIALVAGNLYDGAPSYIKSIYSKHIVSGAIDYDTSEVIYINPHQDDETLAYGLDIIKDIEKGKKVKFIQVTNGGGSGVANSLGISIEKMIESRNKELKYALKEYGVKEEDIVFLNLENRRTSPEDVKKIIDELNDMKNKNELPVEDTNKAVEVLEEKLEEMNSQELINSKTEEIEPLEDEVIENMPVEIKSVINDVSADNLATYITNHKNKIIETANDFVENKDTTNVEIKTLLADFGNDSPGGFADHYACNIAARELSKKYNTKLSCYTFDNKNLLSSDFSAKIEYAKGSHLNKWRKGINRYKEDKNLGTLGIGYKSVRNIFDFKYSQGIQYKYSIYKEY